MAEPIPDLWPEIEQSAVVPPVAVLREQAAFLGKKTSYLLQGQVDTSSASGTFYHSFYIVAPSIDNYRYKLFTISHDVNQYPVEAVGFGRPGPDKVSLSSEQELLDYIREVLNSEKTKKVVSGLLAQVKATA